MALHIGCGASQGHSGAGNQPVAEFRGARCGSDRRYNERMPRRVNRDVRYRLSRGLPEVAVIPQVDAGGTTSVARDRDVTAGVRGVAPELGGAGSSRLARPLRPERVGEFEGSGAPLMAMMLSKRTRGSRRRCSRSQRANRASTSASIHSSAVSWSSRRRLATRFSRLSSSDSRLILEQVPR